MSIDTSREAVERLLMLMPICKKPCRNGGSQDACVCGVARDTMRALLRERNEAQMEWQPISTAPIGKTVLVFGEVPGFAGPRRVRATYHPRHSLPVADGVDCDDWADEGPGGEMYMPAGWYEDTYAEEATAVVVNPTHWMPLPKPPTQEPKHGE